MTPSPGYNPREERLRKEWQALRHLQAESDTVRIQEVVEIPGRPPERYVVTFLCQGITGIDPVSREPRYGSEHRVEIYCDHGYPTDVPRLRWLTDIWHPNIHRDGRVCTNAPEWLAATSLEDLCFQMFEMVQYKNYHAENSSPYPLDDAAAQWVIEFAEPRGIVDKRLGKSVDNQPFYRPDVPRRITVHAQPPGGEPPGVPRPVPGPSRIRVR